LDPAKNIQEGFLPFSELLSQPNNPILQPNNPILQPNNPILQSNNPILQP
jgi:hypothetical protein